MLKSDFSVREQTLWGAVCSLFCVVSSGKVANWQSLLVEWINHLIELFRLFCLQLKFCVIHPFYIFFYLQDREWKWEVGWESLSIPVGLLLWCLQWLELGWPNPQVRKSVKICLSGWQNPSYWSYHSFLLESALQEAGVRNYSQILKPLSLAYYNRVLVFQKPDLSTNSFQFLCSSIENGW